LEDPIIKTRESEVKKVVQRRLFSPTKPTTDKYISRKSIKNGVAEVFSPPKEGKTRNEVRNTLKT
jgi:hypothetical protein